jgi:hypothetical protein
MRQEIQVRLAPAENSEPADVPGLETPIAIFLPWRDLFFNRSRAYTSANHYKDKFAARREVVLYFLSFYPEMTEKKGEKS